MHNMVTLLPFRCSSDLAQGQPCSSSDSRNNNMAAKRAYQRRNSAAQVLVRPAFKQAKAL